MSGETYVALKVLLTQIKDGRIHKLEEEGETDEHDETDVAFCSSQQDVLDGGVLRC